MQDYCINIRFENDIYIALHYTRSLMNQLSFSEMDKQKVIVAVSELTRNILDHANAKGNFTVELIEGIGLKVTVRDQGNGIEHLDKVLNGEGTANRSGLGLGLAGARRMMDDFSITTSKEGTTIECVKWEGK